LGSTDKTCLPAQEFQRIGRRIFWFCMKGFPKRWIIILRAVYPGRNFPHSHLVGRVGERVMFLSPACARPDQRSALRWRPAGISTPKKEKKDEN
jgi:hypothetical protein